MPKYKSPAEKIKDLELKQSQLQARIKNEKAKIRTEARKLDTRKKVVAGAIALEHMNHDPAFAETMKKLLAEHVKESDKHLFE